MRHVQHCLQTKKKYKSRSFPQNSLKTVIFYLQTGLCGHFVIYFSAYEDLKSKRRHLSCFSSFVSSDFRLWRSKLDDGRRNTHLFLKNVLGCQLFHVKRCIFKARLSVKRLNAEYTAAYGQDANLMIVCQYKVSVYYHNCQNQNTQCIANEKQRVS